MFYLKFSKVFQLFLIFLYQYHYYFIFVLFIVKHYKKGLEKKICYFSKSFEVLFNMLLLTLFIVIKQLFVFFLGILLPKTVNALHKYYKIAKKLSYFIENYHKSLYCFPMKSYNIFLGRNHISCFTHTLTNTYIRSYRK